MIDIFKFHLHRNLNKKHKIPILSKVNKNRRNPLEQKIYIICHRPLYNDYIYILNVTATITANLACTGILHVNKINSSNNNYCLFLFSILLLQS